MRVKARVLGLHAEDYTNDKVLEDTDLLYTGVLQLPASFWDKNGKGMESWQHGGFTYYRINGPIVAGLLVNQFVYLENGTNVLCAGARDPRQVGGAARVARLHAREERRVGRHRAQSRAELRAESADGSRMRFRHADRPGGYRQDVAGARGRAVADTGNQALLGDHRHARHGAGGR